jgi:hypoxanthine phosphoribosyltransferase
MSVLYREKQITDKIRDLAININFKHHSDDTPIVFIGILNGAFMFFSDLMKEIHLENIECDFVKVKSYEGKEKKDLIIVKNIELSLKDKHVYIIDDIYDTGETMNYLYKKYKDLNPKSISAITLIKRENSPINDDIELKSAFTIDADKWVYGYGMDDSKGYNRNLPYILAE